MRYKIAAAGMVLVAAASALSMLDPTRDTGDRAGSARSANEALAAPPGAGPLDHVRLDSMLARAERIRPLSSLLVWHRGEMVVERYFRGTRPDQTVNVKSASKSLLSALVGVALRDSLIESVDVPLRELLPELYARLDGSTADDPRKDDIRLRNLLDMSSGLETTSFHNYGQWAASPDWGWDQLRRPMECDPGRCYQYSTGVTHLLGIAIAETAGRDLRSYAADVLFEPMDIDLPAWDRSPRGYYLGGNNMALRPRDLLKFGILYLSDGRWDGRQLLPPEWIETSWQPRFRSPWNGMGYGHLWWVSEWGGEQAYSAWGYGGQFLVVVPRLELAVVATSSLARRERGHNRRMRAFFDEEIIPAFQPIASAPGG